MQVLLLPAKSPDLNIIEKVWAVLKDKVAESQPNSKKQLKKVIIQSWKKISLPFLLSLFERHPHVMELISLNGGAAVN